MACLSHVGKSLKYAAKPETIIKGNGCLKGKTSPLLIFIVSS